MSTAMQRAGIWGVPVLLTGEIVHGFCVALPFFEVILVLTNHYSTDFLLSLANCLV